MPDGLKGFPRNNPFLPALTFYHAFRSKDGIAINNSSVLIADDTLFFPIGPNEIWRVYGDIFWTSVTAKLNVAFNGPASPTNVKIAIYSPNDSTAGVLTSYGAGISGILSGGLGNSFTSNSFSFGGVIQNGQQAGLIQMLFAQGTANASNTIIQNGSCLMAHRIG